MHDTRNTEGSPTRPSHLSWDSMKRLAISNVYRREYDESTLPQSFEVGPVMVQTFNEMLPERSFRSRLVRRLTGNREEDLKPGAFEVGRRIRLVSGKFLIDAKDVGESKRHANGILLEAISMSDQIGMIHTHPIDVPPSSMDVLDLLMRRQYLEFIVTPDRVIFFVPTARTPKFTLDVVAKGYLLGMGRKKGRMGLDISLLSNLMPDMAKLFAQEFGGGDIWQMQYEDLVELGIYGYEAPRGKDEFRLVTHK